MKTYDFNRARRLYRSRKGVFLGVCAGIAERFDFSPLGVRLLFVALQLTIFHWMILVYFALAFWMRRSPETFRRGHRFEY